MTLAHIPPVIVSRYQAFPALVRRSELAPADALVLTVPHFEDIRGAHVICDSVSLEVAAYAAAVTVVALELPEDVDTFSAPIELLSRFAKPPRTYIVRPSSEVAMTQYNGGPTPGSTLLAHKIVAEFKLDPTEIDTLASMIDASFSQEREAGAETEKMLLRALAAERDRRLMSEGQIARNAHASIPPFPLPGPKETPKSSPTT
jgi:hypothetical protein